MAELRAWIMDWLNDTVGVWGWGSDRGPAMGAVRVICV